MTFGRRRIAALAAGAVAVAGVGAGAVAASGGSGPPGASDLAAAINERAGTSITAEQVEGAFLDLLDQRLDEAVVAGRITRAQAD